MRTTATDRLLVAACAVLLVLPVLGPTLPHLSDRFLGIEEVDYYGSLWFYWFVGRGEGLLHTNLFFFPFGKDIFQHTGANVLDALLALPLRWALGPVLGFNLFLLLGRVFDAWAFSRLARAFSTDPVAVGVGSLLFAATPFALYETAEGRPTQAILGLLPLFLLAAWRASERVGWRSPLAAGLLLALIGYQYWYYAFFSGVVAGALCGVRLAWPPPQAGGRRALLGRFVGMALVALALVAPAAIPLFLAAQAGGQAMPGLLDLEHWNMAGLGTPTTVEGRDIALMVWQPLLGQNAFFLVSPEGLPTLLGHQRVTSWVALVLVAAWLWRPGGLDRRVGLAMALAASLLATGPLLVVGTRYLVDPAYLALLHLFGFLRRLWWPGRAYAWLAVLVGLAGVIALAGLARWGRRVQGGAALLICAAWVLDLRVSGLAPMPTWDAAIPAAYRCLASGPSGALIELPFAWTQAHLYYQTAHGRPLLGGMLENNPVFHPPEAIALRQENAWLATVLDTARAGGQERDWTAAERASVQELGFKYVVLQKDALELHGGDHAMSDTIRRTRTRGVRRQLVSLLGQPVYEDARAAIYAPWGDPAPCAAGSVDGDTALAPGRPGTSTSGVRDLSHRSLRGPSASGTNVD